ncbi:MAG TPA: CBS domain-containing protein [Rhodocyclaceae bacterium]|nr:CBS domain-containing protein [Rhodocyclaceae bacterium]
MLICDILEIKRQGATGPLLYTLPPEASLAEAIHRMAQFRIGSIVVSRGEELLGLLTIRELMAILDAHGGDALSKTVGEAMNPNPITGQLTDSIDQVCQVMSENHVSHLPVMEGARIIAIISLQDVAKANHAACAFENRLLKHYISHWPESAERVLS